ncbi:MAG: aminotransferase in exopolysaccharide biosynthesis [Candidatus Azotimanducaceae bacterium]|jgi:aminotransferase in exopolysaccharide biosynthesis
MTEKLVKFIRQIYHTDEFIALCEPVFKGAEKEYLIEAIDSTYVSSVGKYVNRFEENIEKFTGAKKAIATVNGTAAIHAALYLAGIQVGDHVITQAMTFVAACNVMFHMGVSPIFVDVSRKTLGLCPVALNEYLASNAEIDGNGICRHKVSKCKIAAVLPMHTFGHPVEMDELQQVCDKWHIELIEDAAESLGSYYKGQHTGTLSRYGALSFNGNKIITTGGGGMLLCADVDDGVRAKHITTTAKKPHPYEFYHEEAGFNYRLPNLNSALGCAQLERLPEIITQKRNLAASYRAFFVDSEYTFVDEPEHCRSNYWLNAVICKDFAARNNLLKETNDSGVMTRPVWNLMHTLPMYANAFRGELHNSEWLAQRIVNLPSTAVEV